MKDKDIMDKEKPFFSIIIPSYNRALLIIKIIDSFLKQTYPYFELIIVDDGSNDNTKAVFETLKDERVKYYWIDNRERGAARNFGAKLATGDYINYFDSDDLAYSNHLEEACQAITALSFPMVFHLGYEMKDENGRLIHKHRSVNGNGNNKLLRVNYINPNPLFVHKDTLKEVEYCCDRNLSGTEDWLYHLRLMARYNFIAYDKSITSCMIQHDERSMNQYSGNAVLSRNELLLKYLKDDYIFMNRYGNNLSKISAECYGLASLHYALQGKKATAIKTFFKATIQYPIIIFKRRTLGILKYLLLGKINIQ